MEPTPPSPSTGLFSIVSGACEGAVNTPQMKYRVYDMQACNNRLTIPVYTDFTELDSAV